MPERTETLDRIKKLLGRTVGYRGESYQLAEVLDDAGTVILAPTGPNAGIVTDSYGHPAGRGPEFLELPLFDEAGGLSEDIRLITLEEEPD
jgi:hypothetical protein